MNSRVKKFLSFYKPYKKLLIADMICAFLVAGVSLAIPLCVRYITNDVLVSHQNVPVDTVLQIGGVMLGLAVIELFCNYFIAYKGHYMGSQMERDMRNELFSHYQKLSFSFYDEQKTGSLMSRLTTDMFTLAELYHHGPEDVIISVIKFGGAFIILSQINLTLTLLVFAVLPFMVVFAYICNKRMRRAFRYNKEKMAEVSSQAEDNLAGIRVVKSFANEEKEREKFATVSNKYLRSKGRSYKAMGIFHSGLSCFITLITIIVIVCGSLFISSEAIIVGDLLTFLLYVNNLTEPVRKLINFTEQLQQGLTGFDRFMDILELDPDVADIPGAKTLETVEGSVQFQDVSFRYQTSNEVLKNLNLDVKAGEYIALVGTSGAGKTTLCSLIPRFYDVSGGTILIDGEDTQNVTLDSLRKHIGIVQQDVYLFNETILENIRYGRPDATDEEIIEAAKRANAHSFIMGLENGYETNIGQRGIKLSGGQKQRLSIARVFLKNPAILIFDEATSALDNESERVVQESLESLAKGRTTFVIAHRLSTIRNAERIVVLDDDGISEEGTHQTLLEHNGVYANLYRML